MREKQRLLAMYLKTQERGLDDMQKALIVQPNHGLCKKQRLQVTLHHQTSILQQDKDSLTIHKLQALRDMEYPLDTEQLKKKLTLRHLHHQLNLMPLQKSLAQVAVVQKSNPLRNMGKLTC